MEAEVNVDTELVDALLSEVDGSGSQREDFPGSLDSSPVIGEFSSAKSVSLLQTSSCSISQFTGKVRRLLKF